MDNKALVKYTSNVSGLHQKIKERIRDAVHQTTVKVAQDIKDVFTSIYSFRDEETLMSEVVQDRFNKQYGVGTIVVQNRSFHFSRLNYEALDTGFTNVKYGKKGRETPKTQYTASPKLFPIRVRGKYILMVTRSGITQMTEDWQPFWSAFPFTTDPYFDSLVNRSKETVFTTMETNPFSKRIYWRTHAFMLVRTVSTIQLLGKDRNLEEILREIPEYIIVGLQATPSTYRRKKMKQLKKK